MDPLRPANSRAFESWLDAFRADQDLARGSARRCGHVGRMLLGLALVAAAFTLAMYASGAQAQLADRPQPVIDEFVVTPSRLEPGRPVTIEMRVSNASRQGTRDGGMTLSFPGLRRPDDGARLIEIEATEGLNLHVMPAGSRMINRQGSRMAGEYLMVEAQGPWGAGEQKRFRVLIEPGTEDEFEINARSAMADAEWRYFNAPRASTLVDQQGWEVMRETLRRAVAEPEPQPEPAPEPPVHRPQVVQPEPVTVPDEPRVQFEHFVTRRWTADDGLPQSSVNVAIHGSEGYLWIGTLGGLARFDGARFVTFTVAEEPDLGSNRILDLFEDSVGRLWIATEDSGLVRLADGRFEPMPVCARTCLVRQIVQGGGGLWLNTSAGIFRVNPETGWVEEQKSLPAGHGATSAMAWHPRLGLVVASRDRIVLWEGGDRRVQTVSMPDGSDVNALMVIGETLWAATETAVFRMENFSFNRVVDAPAGSPGGFVALHRDGGGAVWLALAGGGLLRRDLSGRVEFVASLADVEAFHIQSDREGNLWIGSRVHGLIRVKPSQVFAPGNVRPELAHPVMPILGDGAGGLLIGRVCGGLVRYTAGASVQPVLPGRLEPCIWALHRAPDGSLLVGTSEGPVQRIRGDTVKDLALGEGSPAVLGARMFLTDRQGRTWMGTDVGLYRVLEDRVELVPDSPREIILSGHELVTGEMLFGTGNGLLRFNGFAFRRVESGQMLDRLPVRHIHEDHEGVLWLGTYGGGLWRREGEDWQQFTTRQGLYDDVVSCILEDRSGRLWMSGNRGIFQARRSELNRMAAGEIDHVASPGLTPADGLPSRETNGGGQPACYQDGSGLLWFPTLGGPAGFNPDEVTRQIPIPPLKIERFRLEGRPLEAIDGVVHLPAGARNLEIDFSAPFLSAPERLVFRYRLTGHETEWTYAGSRRTAYYPLVPGGKLRFEVQVGTDHGVWFPVRSEAELHLHRRLWEQPYFYLGVVLLLAIAGVLLARWRIAELERRDQALQAEVELRTRELQENNRALARLAQVDELTGIANYRRFRLYLNEQWDRCRNAQLPLSVVVIDVDRFKPYNDALGHQAGDECLRSLAQSLDVLVQARGGLLARYGGEEFLAVLPGIELSEAADIAEQLRQAVEALGIARPEPERGVLTASFGVGSIRPTEINDPDQLIASADRALYRAKDRGRNRVEVDEPEDHPPEPNPDWARLRKRIE